MAWTPPVTFSTGQTLTAAHMNALRDNLNETAPAKAITTTNPTHFVGNGVNSIAQREIKQTVVDAAETTTNTSYDDLPAGTVGPAVTITTGSAALGFLTAQISNSSADVWNAASWEAAAGTASDTAAIIDHSSIANAVSRASACSLSTGLTPGSNTFTMKYRVQSGTGTFQRRRLFVMAL